MAWVAILRLILEVGSRVARYLGDKQLIDAGEAKAINANLTQSLDRIKHINEARNDPDTRERVRNKYTRDDE